MTFLENLLILDFFFVAAGVFALISAGLLALLRKYAPDWLRRSKLGEDLGLAPESEPDEITLADLMRWQNENKNNQQNKNNK